MFTGLIGDLGVVGAIEREGDGARLRIRTRLADQLKPGDSIAVNGVCLTATEVSEGGFAAEAMLETLASSSLGSLHEGAAVTASAGTSCRATSTAPATCARCAPRGLPACSRSTPRSGSRA